MEQLPDNPLMLYSVLNTKLRDQYGSLKALCEDLNVEENEIIEKLEKEGFHYMPELNKFV